MLDVDKQLLIAKGLSAQKDEKKVQEVLIALLQQEPHCSPALYMLGGSYFSTEKFAEAVVIFEQLVLMFPEDGKASTGLYNARWKSGQLTEAMEEIKRFLEHADPVAERQTVQAYLRIAETLSSENSPTIN